MKYKREENDEREERQVYICAAGTHSARMPRYCRQENAAKAQGCLGRRAAGQPLYTKSRQTM